MPSEAKNTVLVRSAVTGGIRPVPKDQVEVELSLGNTLVSEVEALALQSAKAKEKQATTPVERTKAVGEAVGRGFVPGYDLVAKQLGQDPEAALARKEALGGIGTALEATALIGSAMLTGGTSLLGKAAGYTGTGLAVKAGAKLAGKVPGAGILAAAGRGAVAAGVETGLISAGQAAGRLAITNEPITIDAIAADAAQGFAIGSIAGGILGGAGKALQVRKAAKQAQKARAIFASDAKALNGALDDVYKAVGTAPKADPAATKLIRKAAPAAGKEEFVSAIKSGDPDRYIKAILDREKMVSEAMAAADDVGKQAIQDAEEAFAVQFSKRVDSLTGGRDVVDKLGDAAAILEIAGLATDIDEKALGPVGSKILGGAIAINFLTKGKSGSGVIARAFKAAVGRGAEGRARGILSAKGVPADIQFAAGAAANIVARKGAAKLIDADVRALVQRQIRAEARVGRAVTRIGKAVTKQATPLTLLNTYRMVETKADTKSKAKAYTEKMNAIKEVVGNPEKMAQIVSDISAPISAVSPTVAEGVKQSVAADLQFLAKNAPQNPGNMQSIGGDRWVMNPQDIARIDRYVRALADTEATVERFLAGRGTPEEAEVLKQRRPGYYAEMQKKLLEETETLEILEREYKIRINLGSLFDVPTDPTLLIGPQMQDHFRVLDEQAAAAQAGPAPNPPSTGLNQPTSAQGLSVPRTNQ